MSKERVQIDQALCDLVKYVLQGGASVSKASAMTGISTATVSRIRQAEFSADRYMENTKKRLKEERIQQRLADQKMPELETGKEKTAAQEIGEMWAKATPVQIPGQLQMKFPQEEEQLADQTKMMRFIAGQVEKILKKLDQVTDAINRIPI